MRRDLTAAVITTAAVLAGILVIVGQSGCGDGEDAGSLRVSRRGEVCRVTSDCAEGLSCAPVPGGSGGGVCVTGQFRVARTAKECAIVECSSATDCCNEDLTGCTELERLCVGLDASPGSPVCVQYREQCGCLSGSIACVAGKCVSRCEADRDCTRSGRGTRCAGGQCVQCALDGDCQPGRQCISGRCQPPCTNDGDCGGFDRCIEARCLPSGCQTDRECIASTRNVDARCGTDGKCIVPCETDLECGNPTSYSFFSCIERECTYVGCESEKDCRLFLLGPSDASALPLNQHVVCRDLGVLGDVVKP